MKSSAFRIKAVKPGNAFPKEKDKKKCPEPYHESNRKANGLRFILIAKGT
jgi:hypothetical protein